MTMSYKDYIQLFMIALMGTVGIYLLIAVLTEKLVFAYKHRKEMITFDPIFVLFSFLTISLFGILVFSTSFILSADVDKEPLERRIIFVDNRYSPEIKTILENAGKVERYNKVQNYLVWKDAGFISKLHTLKDLKGFTNQGTKPAITVGRFAKLPNLSRDIAVWSWLSKRYEPWDKIVILTSSPEEYNRYSEFTVKWDLGESTEEVSRRLVRLVLNSSSDKPDVIPHINPWVEQAIERNNLLFRPLAKEYGGIYDEES